MNTTLTPAITMIPTAATIHEREVLITDMLVGLRHDIGAAASKARPPGCRNRYSYELEYTLADGRKIKGHISGATRAKLEDAVLSRRESIARKAIKATFGSDGQHWGTSQSFGFSR